MAYSEVIKNFNRVRDYMREFYVYGFKSRDEYTKKSGRSYDDERRRLESWLGDHMQFRQKPDGKTVFLSIDSRSSHHNPLYKAWKAKSFTDGDITLHFILMDLLSAWDEGMTIKEIAGQVDLYLSAFDQPKTFDDSTIRKKLKEYEAEGIVVKEKRGKEVCYKRVEDSFFEEADILDFFSEVSPCGVIGSFLLDKLEEQEEVFSFKHHYITGAMDSEILCLLFTAIREKRSITMETLGRGKERSTQMQVVPLHIMLSAQSGRQYLMAYISGYERLKPFRLDHILSVKIEEESPGFDEYRKMLEGMLPHIWGVSTQSRSGERMERVEFTIRYGEDEPFIPQRLEREKRIGKVEHLDGNTSRFSAQVFDASELIPWIRTFICRITEFHCSDQKLEEQFLRDIEEMYTLYDMEGGGPL